MMRQLTRIVMVACLVSVNTVAAQSRSPATTADRPVVLLVHGLKHDLDAPLTVWGVKTRGARGDEWSGLIGRLAESGRAYGGAIRPRARRLQLPEHLEAGSATPAAARVFALEFSETANVDGLAFKALELAEHWGDFFGTRASSLKPTAGLIRRLNDDLDLPKATGWASVIVRGTSIGAMGIRQQEPLIVPLFRRDAPAQLPLDLIYGGDQIVDVRSQNLALTRCAERYERLTNRPIVTLVARIPDPTPADESPLEATVHELAPRHTATLDTIELLLHDDRLNSPWHPTRERLPNWLTDQLRLHAASEVEWQTAQLHKLSEIQRTDLIRCDIRHDRPHSATVDFEGRAHSLDRVLRLFQTTTRVRAVMRVTWNDCGRIEQVQTTVRDVNDE